MKTTALTTKCLSGAGPAARPRGASTMVRAHTPARRLAAACEAGAAPVTSYTEASALRPAIETAGSFSQPRVLHLDANAGASAALAALLAPQVDLVHAATLVEARRLLGSNVFSLLIVDPALPDGDVRRLFATLACTPVLVYAEHQCEWGGVNAGFLAKASTTPRQLWSCITTMLGVSSGLCAGA